MKLEFELVPDSLWGSNLRSILSKAQWDFIKKDAKIRYNNTCAICGQKTDRLDAHEKWEYDDTHHVQKLVDVLPVCKKCHSVIHIGYTSLKGDIVSAENHFMKVNGCSYQEYKDALNRANELHKKRNQVGEWALDITWLKRYTEEK